MKTIRYLLLLLLPFNLFAQGDYYYWLEYKADMAVDSSVIKPSSIVSSKSLERRKKFGISWDKTDQPLPAFVFKQLKDSGYQITGTSRWLKSVVVHHKQKDVASKLKQLPGVIKVTAIGQVATKHSKIPIKDINELLRSLETRINPEIGHDVSKGSYGHSLLQNEMINTIPLHEKGLEGNGVCIAVLDAGFNKLNENLYFTHFFGKRHLMMTRDLVDPETDVYDDAEHGTCVLSCMAAYQPAGIKGTARNADYILIRTEDDGSESLLEEFYWVMGAELADSAGADLIQSSLGYNQFDESMMSHRHKDLDGKTTFISKGAALAVQKGILVVNSSGNEGDGDWRKIVAPADVKEVLTVGGVDATGFPSAFSSTGPTADRRIKPDVAALAEKVYVVSGNGVLYPGNGTSYAAPLISGGIACLMQACPKATPDEINNALRLSASIYDDADKYLGYGIPDMLLACRILGGDSLLPLNQNQLLDARYLSDKRIHYTIYIAQPQKLTLLIKGATDQVIYKDQFKIKQPGIYRFSIRASKRFPAGDKVMLLNGMRPFQIQP